MVTFAALKLRELGIEGVEVVWGLLAIQAVLVCVVEEPIALAPVSD